MAADVVLAEQARKELLDLKNAVRIVLAGTSSPRWMAAPRLVRLRRNADVSANCVA